MHSPTRDGRGRDLSGHAKKPIDRGRLTFWRQQRKGLVRTRKQTDRPRRTHFLETAEGGTCQDTQTTDRARPTHFLETAEEMTCQDMQRNRPTEDHSQTGDGRGMDLSGHGMKPTEGGPLTPWRRQRKGLVRTRKKTDRGRPTHILKTAEEGICQDTQRNQPTGDHSQTGDGRGTNLSGHEMKPTGRGPLTAWRRQKERLVRTWKWTDRPRRTHKLETAEGGTCQDTEANRPTEAHSHPGDGRGRHLSGHAKNPTDRGPLTN